MSKRALPALAGAAVTPDVLKERMADPITWPCGDDGINGRYRRSCRAPCCIVPPKTPDDEDSPKWKKTLEERENEECNILQPDFGSPDTPAFSPSQCSSSDRNFFGRRHLRIMYGQDPQKNPELFTPPKPNPMHFVWPAWPEDANKCTCSRCA